MKRITDEQIISILREAEAGVSSRELCRKDARFYTWRKMYGGLEVPEVKRLKSLKEDNARQLHLCNWPDHSKRRLKGKSEPLENADERVM